MVLRRPSLSRMLSLDPNDGIKLVQYVPLWIIKIQKANFAHLRPILR